MGKRLQRRATYRQSSEKKKARIILQNKMYMKKIHSAILFASLFAITKSHAQTVDKVTDPVEWVNPLMGTDSKPSLSNGNTYPSICVPWGMNFWTPQTGRMGDGWAYTYASDKIRGFKQTHQPSPWMNDYGQFSIMPVTGKLRFREDDRASWFSHKAEISKPYYYSLYLADADVTTEITQCQLKTRDCDAVVIIDKEIEEVIIFGMCM
jgi:putative alpha-1,2-mannosidase